MKKNYSQVINPNLGLYLDRALLSIPHGGLQAGYNFRIQQGKITNSQLGWTAFGPFTLNGPVNLIATMHLRTGNDVLIFGTPKDLYKYSSSGSGSVTYLTPTYITGTAAASGINVTGIGTTWNTGTPTHAKIGDQISFGSASQTSTAATWFTVASVIDDTHLTLTGAAGSVSNGPYTIRRLFGGTVADTWEYDVFVNAQPSSEDRIYFTNGVDFPVRWNGSDTFATLLDTIGFTCKRLIVYKNMLLYANLTQGGSFKPSDLINSDVATPENVTTNLAGQFKISGTTDQILAMRKLGDYLVIYMTKIVILASFVGAPLVFVFRVAVDGKGIQSSRAVATYPNFHEYLGADTLYAFDGSSAKDTSNHVFREIVRTQDPVRVGNVFTTLDEHRGDYIWSVPLTTDPGSGTVTSPPVSAYAGHYLETVPQGAEMPYSMRAFPFYSQGTFQRQNTITWDQLTQTWASLNFRWNDRFLAASFPLTLVGDANGKVWSLNSSQNANGAALPSYVKFGRRPVTDGIARSLIARVYPYVTQFDSLLTITANLTDFANGPTSIQAQAVFNQSLVEGLFFAPIYRVGRYCDMQFSTDGPDQPYEIAGYDWQVRQGGMR